MYPSLPMELGGSVAQLVLYFVGAVAALVSIVLSAGIRDEGLRIKDEGRAVGVCPVILHPLSFILDA